MGTGRHGGMTMRGGRLFPANTQFYTKIPDKKEGKEFRFWTFSSKIFSSVRLGITHGYYQPVSESASQPVSPSARPSRPSRARFKYIGNWLKMKTNGKLSSGCRQSGSSTATNIADCQSIILLLSQWIIGAKLLIWISGLGKMMVVYPGAVRSRRDYISQHLNHDSILHFARTVFNRKAVQTYTFDIQHFVNFHKSLTSNVRVQFSLYSKPEFIRLTFSPPFIPCSQCQIYSSYYSKPKQGCCCCLLLAAALSPRL